MTTGTVLWTPPADVLETSRMGRFMTWLRTERGVDAADYAELWQWSVTDLEGFWRAIWDYFEVIAHTEPTATLPDAAMPGARWFPGATLNYAEHVLRMPGLGDDDPVVIAYSQTREPVTLTARQLRDRVRRVAADLRRLGVGPGDRVAAYAPNIPETYVLMLATAALGAVFSSCAPEFGSRSVIDRWTQIEPKVLVAVDGYRYGDKAVDRREEVAAIRAALPSVEHLITIGYLNGGGDWDGLDGDEPMTFAPVPFAHPLYVLYSSGTTGLPKPIVHGHGGILLEHLKMLALHHDLGPGDRFFWFTTTGWMMWNFLASGPAVGAAIVLFDGHPGHPGLDATWRLAADAGVTYFGTSAPFLMACRKAGVVPPAGAIRAVGSTGAPLPPEGFRWVYEVLGDAPQLQSLSGGTDVCTGFVGGTPLLPVIEGVISCRALGSRVEAYDPEGKPVIGELGELVITAPMPSMPVGFWNDPDGLALLRGLLRRVPGRVAARRLDHHRRGRQLRHHRSFRRHPEPGRGAAGHRRVLLGGRGCRRHRRLRRRAPRRRRPGRAAALRGPGRGRRARRRAARPDPRRAACRALAAARPRRDPSGTRGAAHAVGQEAGGAGEADPHRHPCGPGRGAGCPGQSRVAYRVRGARRVT
nr:acetoacetate--CoA ligase [Actinoplanes digitatis]